MSILSKLLNSYDDILVEDNVNEAMNVIDNMNEEELEAKFMKFVEFSSVLMYGL